MISPTDEIVSTCLHKSTLIESDKRQKAELDKQRRMEVRLIYKTETTHPIWISGTNGLHLHLDTMISK